MIANHKLPNYLRDIYPNLTYKEKAYLNIRWRLCPFQKIESLLPEEGFLKYQNLVLRKTQLFILHKLTPNNA